MTNAMQGLPNFEIISMEQIKEEDLRALLEHFSINTYSATSEHPEANTVLQRCICLMKIDYNLSVINNNCGELCGQYPSQLPILECENARNQNNAASSAETSQATDTTYTATYDINSLRELITKSKNARCRQRFAIPTILFRGKYICRSATLSGGVELYSRSGLDYLLGKGEDVPEEEMDDALDNNSETSSVFKQSEWPLFDKVRGRDIYLLKKMNIGTIVDFMVENKKRKLGMKVTSSEKIDKENRYSDFTLMALPYPGCEFFKEFSDRNFEAKGLVFNWSHEECDATLKLPDSPIISQLNIDWENYKKWDLITITQNYMKCLLKYFKETDSGLLLHCISGWDRTPLFISLIRLSLWADGLIHQGLDEYQMLFLTIGYDWMLFGHHLYDRLGKGEDIFFFCFYMLKYLTDDQFSLAPGRYIQVRKEESPKRADNDIPGDIFPEPEHDFNGSNMSLNSLSSVVNNPLQESTLYNQDEVNGNPSSAMLGVDVPDAFPFGTPASPQGKRTSPVPVPGGNRPSSAQSNSSSTGSWQMVNSTGSVKSFSGDIPPSSTSKFSAIDENESNESATPVTIRKEKLLAVRKLFYTLYFQSIKNTQLSAQMGPESSLGAVVGNIVERISLSQRT